MTNGKVYLVGAGPGDPGLITVKGLECLRQAEVVIYDRLLDDRLLEAVPPTAERVYVGKGRGELVMPQKDINRLLVEKAKTGRMVVRLKGGDPFVLGRGGEEAEALAREKIPFEIVPGVTSAVAVPAYAGIPVTHRGIASSFAVITGHEDPQKESSSLDWARLASGADTMVFLMGMQNLARIVTRLLEHGRPPETPAAVIENGTRPNQRTVTGSLANIVAKAEEENISPPAIIVVGDVVRLREEIRWFDNRPLSGKRVLVTRARHQASALSRLLAERGAQPIELPAIEIQEMAGDHELDLALTNIGRYHWLILTSTNGVEAFFKRLHGLKLDTRSLKDLKIAAIGPATAQALTQKGIVPDYLPEVYTAHGILAGLRGQPVAGRRFLLPRADIADKELTEGLRQLGAEVEEIAAYRTMPAHEAIARAKKILESGEIDVVTFTSSSTVNNLTAAFEGEKVNLGKAKVACIGAKTADTATRAGLKVDMVAREATIPALVAAIEEYFARGL